MKETNKNSEGLGPVGYCICPKCGYRKEHTSGVPCRDEKCPNCGSIMVREGSYHHKLIEDKKKNNQEKI